MTTKSLSSLLIVLLTLLPTVFACLTSNIIECLTSNEVPFHTAASSNWTSLITPYNLRISWEPSVVTLPFTPGQVSDSVTCAAAAGLKVQTKSGGHSYAGFSTGGRNGSLIINLQNFNNIEVDEIGIAVVGAGVRLGNLARELYAQGERALPHGVCPGVGVGGHFTHGGYGYQSRAWGLALDSIVGLDVILADGSFVHATAERHHEVFFAMRGAADSFGVVTTFYLQTRAAPTSIVTFSANIPDALNDPEKLADALSGLQATALDPVYMSRNVSFSLYINNKRTFSLRGWCIECNEAYVNTTLFPKLLHAFPTPSKQSVKALGWIDSLIRLAEGTPLNVPLYDYSLHENFATKSFVSNISTPLTKQQWTGYWSFVKNQALTSAPTPWYSTIDMYGGHDSQINYPSSESSAFSHRDTLWVIQNSAYTPNNVAFPTSSARAFLEEFTSSVTGGNINDFGIYLNCADPDLSADEVAERGYGHSTYNKLFSLKQKLDPGFIFWNPQAIGNAEAFPSDAVITRKQNDELRR